MRSVISRVFVAVICMFIVSYVCRVDVCAKKELLVYAMDDVENLHEKEDDEKYVDQGILLKEELKSEEIDGSCMENAEEVEKVDNYIEPLENIGSNGIQNNGKGGIYINIYEDPFTTLANLGYDAYGPNGCGWFASARAKQLTGNPNITTWNHYGWYRDGGAEKCGFSKGTQIKAPSLVCWSGHIAVLEKIDGGTYYFSEGGTGYAPDNDYTRLFKKEDWEIESYLKNNPDGNGSFLGFVYLGSSNNPPNGVVNEIEATSDGKIHIRGWAFDWDNTSKALLIHVYVGTPSSSTHTTPDYICTANKARTDITGYGAGTNHGFEETFSTAKKGSQTVYIYAIDALGGDDYNSYLEGNNGKTINIPNDTQKPTISNVQCLNKDRNGYTLKCSVSDDIGVTKVQFATCTQASGKTDWKYYEVTPTNNTATCTIKTSDFGDKEGQYFTDIYAFDASGKRSDWNKNATYYPMIDRTKPEVTSAEVISYDNEGFVVRATATDNVGVTKIQFPTFASGDSEENIIWYDGSEVVNGISTCRINAKDYNYKKGKFTIDIRAYDADGNMSSIVDGTSRIRHVIDEIAPVISNVWTEQISDDTIKVTCDVTDNIDVSKVAFPTWTEKNSELNSDIWNSYAGQRNGNTWSFLVKDSDNGFDRTGYITEIHAKDKYNNETVYKKVSFDFTNLFESNIRFEYNGHLYEVYDDILMWDQAKSKCEQLGGHLVTITSGEEQAAITAAIERSVRSRFYIGAQTGDSTWITGEPITYTNWAEGQPDNKEGEDKFEIYNKAGMWNDVGGEAPKGEGFICEYENLDKKEIGLKGISLSKTNIKIYEGDSERLDVIFNPKNTTIERNVEWSTSDVAIATVENGVITGLKSGTANITAEVGGKKAICTVLVEKRITEVLVNPQSNRIFVGQNAKLHISTNTGTIPVEKTTITNSNPAIVSCTADLDSGTISIRGLSEGNTRITVKIDDIEASVQIDVTFPTIIFKDQDGSDLSILPIKAIYGAKYPELPIPVANGKVFVGWCTGADYSGTMITSDAIFEGENVLYAAWVQNDAKLRIIMSNEHMYSGSKIYPQIKVYDGDTLLSEKKDYTIAYKNNTNAYRLSEGETGFNPKKAPMVTVSGKGNYSNNETVYFRILPVDIADEAFNVDNISLAFNKKSQKVSPVLYWDGRILKNGSDYKVDVYRADDIERKNSLGIGVKDAGDYIVKITGKNNFTGTREVNLKVSGTLKPVSKLSVGKIANVKYTGSAIAPEPVVKDGSKLLVKDTHYTLSYIGNLKVGTGYILIKGNPDAGYSGTRRVSFKIMGTPLSKAVVEGLPKSVSYTGNEIVFGMDVLKLYLKEGNKTPRIDLVRDKDYEVSYTNNIRTGKATVIFTGMGGYTGTVKKNVNITPYDITSVSDTTEKFTVNCPPSVAYSKGGARPELNVTFKNADGSIQTLVPGTDYTLSYKYNNEVNGTKKPLVTVKGKGNFKGSRSVEFTITAKDLNQVILDAADVVYKDKANIFTTKVSIIDTDGKRLKAGTDYAKLLKYSYLDATEVKVNGSAEMRAAGSEVGKDDIIPVNTVIKVTADAVNGGNYSGNVSGTYRITKASIASANVTGIQVQEYTGKEIKPDPATITVKVGNATLKLYDEKTGEGDFVIKGYENNIKKGTAKMILQGVGNYGGTKTVSFKIKAKGFRWWWR